MVRCQYCNYSSENTYNVKRHEKAMHKSSVKYSFPSLVNSNFQSVNNQSMSGREETHDIWLKENFKCFSCEFCAYTSKRRYDVKTHTQGMHTIKTDEYGQHVNNEAHPKQKYETYDMNEDKYLEK